MKFYRKNFDLEEKRIRGLITDEMYYILKRKEAVGDYYKQKELISLQIQERRIKKQEKEKQKEAHEKEIAELKQKHSKEIASIKQKHNIEMAKVKQKQSKSEEIEIQKGIEKAIEKELEKIFKKK